MLKLFLIRHGKTFGNTKQRYIGRRTDEPLEGDAVKELETFRYDSVEAVYASPMIRCTQTAKILFPENKINIIDELSECDFGEFENKNYIELEGNANYQAWIDSNGQLPFPGGESREAFRLRTLKGFQKAVDHCVRNDISCGALVVHGGTIMNVMEAYADEKHSFYHWQVKNGKGYEVELDPVFWKRDQKKLHVIRTL